MLEFKAAKFEIKSNFHHNIIDVISIVYQSSFFFLNLNLISHMYTMRYRGDHVAMYTLCIDALCFKQKEGSLSLL